VCVHKKERARERERKRERERERRKEKGNKRTHRSMNSTVTPNAFAMASMVTLLYDSKN